MLVGSGMMIAAVTTVALPLGPALPARPNVRRTGPTARCLHNMCCHSWPNLVVSPGEGPELLRVRVGDRGGGAGAAACVFG